MISPGNRRWLALVALLCALVAAGCKRRTRNRIITLEENFSSDFFNSDQFPGSQVQVHNVADDKRAFSVPDEAPTLSSLRVTYNGGRETAIVTYTTAGAVGLYAHYYNGEVFTPPVALRAVDTDFSGLASDRVVCAFFNTENHPDNEAQERNGDALVAWLANDVDSDAAGPDAPNRALFVTYFDESHHDEIDRRFGFQEFATRVDTQDGPGESAGSPGCATDGLCGAALWGGFQSYAYGQETTAVELIWLQAEDTGGGTDAGLYSARFDPAESLDDDLPLTPQRTTRHAPVLLGASDSGVSAGESIPDAAFYVTYNNVILFRMGLNNATAGVDAPGFSGWGVANANGTDMTLQAIAIDLESGTINPATLLHPGAPVATDSVENYAHLLFPGTTPRPHGIFGSDEGLAAVVVFFTNLNGDPDGDVDFGDPVNDGRLVVAELEEATGSLLGIREIDAEDVTISDSVDPFETVVQLSRNGDYAWAAFRKADDVGASADLNIWAVQYQTTRIGEDDVLPVPGALTDTTSAPVALLADFDGSDADWFLFQDALGYICGVQSNPDVMNVFAKRTEGASDVIYQSRLTADVDTDPAGCTPSTATAALESFEAGTQPGANAVNGTRLNFNAADNGDDGNVVAFYRQDIDPIGTDFRLFAENGGTEDPGKVEIDSVVDFRQVRSQSLLVACTPLGSDIGTFDPVGDEEDSERAYAAKQVHVFFFEDASTETSTNGDALRTRAFFTDVDDDFTLGGRFQPSADLADFELPFDLGLPNLDSFSANEPVVLGILAHDETLGVYFTQSEHVYLTLYDGNSTDPDDIGWLNNDGVSDPYLVDDDTTFELPAAPLLFSQGCECDTLEFSMVFWTKETDGFSGRRLFVRVLDGETD